MGNHHAIPSSIQRCTRRPAFLGLGAATLATLLSACQILAPQPSDRSDQEPGRLINRPATIATQAPRGASPELTAAVKRGTRRDTVVLAGQVVPARTAQLSFRTGGTVRAVHVRAGQPVSKGDPLLELALDETALKAAQAQANVAELAYQSQQQRISELRQGLSTATLEELRASVTKARAGLVEAQLARAAPVGPASSDLQLARLALDQANDDLAQAETTARRSREEAENDTSALAVRTAERKVEEATLKLSQLRTTQAATQTTRQREREQAQRDVDQARDELTRVQLVAQRNQQDAQSRPSAAAQTVRDAERKLAEAALRYEQLQLQQSRANPTPSTTNAPSNATTREAERALARGALEDARDELERARVAAERSTEDAAAGNSLDDIAVRSAQRKLEDAVAKLQNLQTNPPTTSSDELRVAQLALDQANDDLAQARVGADLAARRRQELAQASSSASAVAVRSAERKTAEATLKLQQVLEKQRDEVAVRESRSELPDLQLAAAQATLSAAEARLQDALRGSSSAQNLPNEERRLSLLLDEAFAVRAGAQPVVVLTAPFDGTITSVDVATNQTVDAKTTVARLDDPGQLSILAQASESEVSRLMLDKPVDVTFPGITNDSGLGIIREISGVATRQGDKVTFPVRVDLQTSPTTVKLGMTASINVVAREAADTLSVPTTALRTVGGRATVTRVGPDGTVQDVPVAIGATYGSDVEIISGVAAGDSVAIYTNVTPSQSTARR